MEKKQWFPKTVSVLLALLVAAGSSVTALAETADPDVVLVYKTHFDIGFTGYASDVIQRYRTTFIDQALNAIDASSSLPPEQQFKWTIPGWPMKKILEDWPGQTPERQNRIRQAFEDQRLLVHAMPYSMQTEAVDAEDMVRAMRFSSDISREFGQSLPRSAKMTDVPEQSWLLPTILKNAGIDILHIGINPGCTPADVPPMFFWEGPDGSRVLTMYSADYGVGVLPPADWDYNVWLGMTMTGDNHGPPTISDVQKNIKTVTDAGKTYKIGSIEEFADIILKGDTSKIPVIRGDMPDTWIHGIMSAPTETKISRNVRPQILSLDSLGTLLSMWDVQVPDSSAIVDSAYEDLLRYGEHTWGYNEHIEDYGDTFKNNLAAGKYDDIQGSWDEKTDLAYNAQDAVVPALEEYSNMLAESVNVDGQRIVVYNSLPWERGGVVTMDLPANTPTALKDSATGEIIEVSSDGKTLSFIAEGVPSMGYKTYTYASSAPTNPAVSTAEGNVMENKFFTVTLDASKGTVSSIIEKSTGRELVREDNAVGFGQYMNQRFSKADVDKFGHTYNRYWSGWVLDDYGKSGLPSDVPHKDTIPENLALTYEKSDTSVSAVMTDTAKEGEYAGMSVKVTLYDDQPYIDFDWSVDDKVKDPAPIADWMQFAFNVDDPEYRLSRVGGVINPETDIVKNTELNNFALDGGLTITDAKGNGVGLCSKDVPLVSIGKPGIWEFDKEWNPAAPNVYVNLFNNQWDTNYPTWNGGDWSSNIRVWSVNGASNDNYEQSLVTPSQENRSALTAAYADDTKGKLPANQSGLKLSEKGVYVTAFGDNIDGDGTILRLWEQGGRDVDVTVTLPKAMRATSVQPVDLRGTPIGRPVPVVNDKFTVSMSKNAPYSAVIDYESAADENTAEVQNLTAAANTDGGIDLTWNENDVNAKNIQIAWAGVNGSGSQTVDAGVCKATIDSVAPGEIITVAVKTVDQFGNVSKGVTAQVKTADSPVVKVKSVKAGSTYNGNYYDPMNVANGSGLTGRNPKTATYENDGHAASMWHSQANAGTNAWLEFDFGMPKALDKMYIWNMNQYPIYNGEESAKDHLNRGFKNVKIEYKINESDPWTALSVPDGMTFLEENTDTEFPFQLTKADGSPTMPATNLNDGSKTPVSFSGVKARYVRMTPKSTWGQPYFGMSEVMFTEIEGEIASLEAAEVSTMQSVAPELPSFVTAVSSLGTQREIPVVWDEIDPASYETPGTFTVEGSVFGTELKASCAVTVKAGVTADDTVADASVEADGETGVTLRWADPEADFSRIEVSYKSAVDSGVKSIAKGIQTALISGLKPNQNYKFTLVTIDEAGHRSNGVTLLHKTSGASVLTVKNAAAGSSYNSSYNPINLANGSGLTGINPDTATHDNDSGAYSMWHTVNNANSGNAWAEFDFGSPQTVDTMYIWNMNQENTTMQGDKKLNRRGFKNVKIEYKVNEADAWTALTVPEGMIFAEENTDAQFPFQLTKASGENGILATNLNDGNQTPVDFGGVKAQYIRITPKDSWGDTYWGLSEVMFKGAQTLSVVDSVTPVDISTQIGTAPILPELVKAIYDDGTTRDTLVVWDAIDPALYAQAGSFAVNGSIPESDVKAVANVTVSDAPVIVNKSILDRLISDSYKKAQMAYTPESWQKMIAARDEAIAVSESDTASQAEVNTAALALETAIGKLMLSIDRAGFDAKVIDAATFLLGISDDQMYDDEKGEVGQVGQYPMSKVKSMLAAYSTAQELSESLPETLTEYDKQTMVSAYNDMMSAWETLESSKKSGYELVLTGAENVSGEVGTTVPMELRLTGFPTGEYRSIEAVLALPDGMTVADVKLHEENLSGAPLDWNVSDGKLYIAVMDANAVSTLTAATPDQAFALATVQLQVTEKQTAGSTASVTANKLDALTADEVSTRYDVSKAKADISFIEEAIKTVTTDVLYTGDGVDLVPDDKKAISFTFSGIPSETNVKLGDTVLYYSSERTKNAASGQVVYVGLVKSDLSTDYLNEVENYTFTETSETDVQKILFGHTNTDNELNAQDALNILQAWLRKEPVSDDRGLLVMNVTSDARIDTSDAIAVIDKFISGSEFEVISK